MTDPVETFIVNMCRSLLQLASPYPGNNSGETIVLFQALRGEKQIGNSATASDSPGFDTAAAASIAGRQSHFLGRNLEQKSAKTVSAIHLILLLQESAKTISAIHLILLLQKGQVTVSAIHSNLLLQKSAKIISAIHLNLLLQNTVSAIHLNMLLQGRQDKI